MNEIFKGMDNSAEQINENFQNGSIVESGKNENGYYVKYGDGTLLLNTRITIDRANDKSYSYGLGDLGVVFIDNRVSGAITSSVNGFNDMADVWTLGYSFSDSGVRLFKRQGTPDFSGTGSMDVDVFAMGRWKE